jgi:NADH-quinone oxidoreductase subunit H
VDKVFFILAPAVAMGTALLALAVVPFGPTQPAPQTIWPQTLEQQDALHNQAFAEKVEKYEREIQGIIAPHIDIGFLFTFAAGSLAVYGVIMGGWSSNNKYNFMGGLRASAQIISYEIPMGLSALGVVVLTGSLNLERVIDYQDKNYWNVLYQPLGCLIFLISIFAETNRLPFDLVEAEQELVGGFHTEYSAMKFGLFFLGEYTHMITTSFLLVALYFGGWQFPWIAESDSFWLLKLGVFVAKMFGVILLYMMVRWTLLRFRFDQLMGLAWKGLIPLALLNVVAVMVVGHLAETFKWDAWVRVVLLVGASAALLLVSGVRVAALPGKERARLPLETAAR